VKTDKTYKLFVVAGTGSGCGKTSITCGLIGAFRNRGLTVQPFKVGPDYLDPSWLTAAASRPCVNLDTWMTSPEYVSNMVAGKMADADIGIIEGVMGLYDGAGAASADGSTAEIANLLNAPVFLIVNSHGTSRSFAASVYGFVHFPDAPRIAGIIANHCGSNRHREMLNESLLSVNLPPLIGSIGHDAFPSLPGRHLGLHSASTLTIAPEVVSKIASACETSVDIDTILNNTVSIKFTADINTTLHNQTIPGESPVRIAYAYDRAFHFYYQDTLDLLSENGAELIPFSPLNDTALPDDIDGLYLGGGYPEISAKELSENTLMLKSIKSFADSKKTIFAECGGLMYCGQSVIDIDNKKWSMTGILSFETSMTDKLQRFGYCDIELEKNCIIGNKGTRLRGHEFHYSSITSISGDLIEDAFKITYTNGRTSVCGFSKDNILASYIHLHWGNNPQTAAHFLESIRKTVPDSNSFTNNKVL